MAQEHSCQQALSFGKLRAIQGMGPHWIPGLRFTLRNCAPFWRWVMALRILVADDDEVVRRGVCVLLESHDGWKVCGEAADGRDAVWKSKQLKHDIGIHDIRMQILSVLADARDRLR